MIKNYMEILINEIYDEVKKNYKVCKCKNYEDDIKSIALSNLPPTYFTSSTSEAVKTAFLLDRQRRITVVAKLTEAINILCNNCKVKDESII